MISEAKAGNSGLSEDRLVAPNEMGSLNLFQFFDLDVDHNFIIPDNHCVLLSNKIWADGPYHVDGRESIRYMATCFTYIPTRPLVIAAEVSSGSGN